MSVIYFILIVVALFNNTIVTFHLSFKSFVLQEIALNKHNIKCPHSGIISGIFESKIYLKKELEKETN